MAHLHNTHIIQRCRSHETQSHTTCLPRGVHRLVHLPTNPNAFEISLPKIAFAALKRHHQYSDREQLRLRCGLMLYSLTNATHRTILERTCLQYGSSIFCLTSRFVASQFCTHHTGTTGRHRCVEPVTLFSYHSWLPFLTWVGRERVDADLCHAGM